jgi:hypothetical protein
MDICAGDTLILTTGSGSSYLWSTGEITQSIAVTDGGVYAVTVMNESGCSANSEPVTIAINPLPEAEITADGQTSFCSGDSVALTSTDASTYQWSIGDTTQTILVQTGGVYQVTVTSADGCTAIAESVEVVVYAPVAEITVDGPPEACAGDTVVLTASVAPGYAWSTGDSLQTIEVVESGQYTVSVTDSLGCTGVSSVLIEIHELPQAPEITEDEGSLMSSAPFGNQWYLNGMLIDGATSQWYVPEESGLYTVALTDSNGCTVISDPYLFTIVGLNAPGAYRSLLIIPNPSTGRFRVEDAAGIVSKMALYSLTGKLVFQAETITGEFDLTHLPKGMYFVGAEIEGQVFRGKVILQ